MFKYLDDTKIIMFPQQVQKRNLRLLQRDVLAFKIKKGHWLEMAQEASHGHEAFPWMFSL